MIKTLITYIIARIMENYNEIKQDIQEIYTKNINALEILLPNLDDAHKIEFSDKLKELSDTYSVLTQKEYFTKLAEYSNSITSEIVKYNDMHPLDIKKINVNRNILNDIKDITNTVEIDKITNILEGNKFNEYEVSNITVFLELQSKLFESLKSAWGNIENNLATLEEIRKEPMQEQDNSLDTTISSEIDSLEKELNNKDQKIKELEQEIKIITSSRMAPMEALRLENLTHTLEKDNTKLKKEAKDLNKEILDLKNEIRNLNENITEFSKDYENKLGNLEKKQASLAEQLEKQKSTNKEKESLIETLNTKINTLEAQLSVKNAEILTKDQKIITQNNLLDGLLAEKVTLNQEIKKLKDQESKENETLSKEFTNLFTEIGKDNSLQKEYNELKNENSSLKQWKPAKGIGFNFKQAYEAIKELVSNLRIKISNILSELTKTQKELDNANTTIENHKDEIKKLKDEHSKQKDNYTNMEFDLTKVINDKDAEINRLKDQLAKMEKQPPTHEQPKNISQAQTNHSNKKTELAKKAGNNKTSAGLKNLKHNIEKEKIIIEKAMQAESPSKTEEQKKETSTKIGFFSRIIGSGARSK
jgi:chromosome segregation ATPase